jgi:CII-binding regulator of phage lambda lysogenization HflD
LSAITQIQDNSHILGIYSSPERKIEDGLEYLRSGFEQKNEAILMIN